MSTHPVSEESLLPVLRTLLECHTQVERVSSRHMESMGLTPSQFDVLATLGDTPGMTCKELGERTLITKGTLSPVLDRLEAKGLLKREKGPHDQRQTNVTLTIEGQKLYEATFMPHVNFMKPRLDVLNPDEQTQLISLLRRLQAAFQ